MWIKGEYHAKFDSIEALARGGLDRGAQNGAGDSGQPDLFDRLGWFQKLHQYCAPRSLPLVVRSRADQSDMWLFLVHQSRTHLKSLSNWYSFHFRPVFTGAASDKTKLALLQGAASRLKKKFSHISLNPVAERDGSLALIESGFKRAGWLVISEPCDTNHYLEVGGQNFDDYWASRPGALRSTLDRKAKKSKIEIEIYTNFDEAAWADYEQVYAASWKPQEGNPDFLKAIAQDEAEGGALRLGVARLEGRPVAAQFWTIDNGVANIHKLAHVSDDDGLSPGTQLSAAMFRHAIDEDGVETIDFGTGDDSYKKDWVDSQSPLYRIEMYNLSKPQAWLPAIRKSIVHLLNRR